MKAKLIFNLDDHDEVKAHRRCMNAPNAYMSLSDMDDVLRKIIKYSHSISEGSVVGNRVLTANDSQLLHDFTSGLREVFTSILEENNINLDDL